MIWGKLSWLTLWSGIQVASGVSSPIEVCPWGSTVLILKMKETFEWWLRVSGQLSPYYLPPLPSSPASCDLKEPSGPLSVSHFLSLSVSVFHLPSNDKLKFQHVLCEITVCGGWRTLLLQEVAASCGRHVFKYFSKERRKMKQYVFCSRQDGSKMIQLNKKKHVFVHVFFFFKYDSTDWKKIINNKIINNKKILWSGRCGFGKYSNPSLPLCIML